jgi:hypothetical protein
VRRRTPASVAIEVSPSVSGVGTTSRSMNLTRPRSTDLGSSGCPPWFWWAGWISMTSHVTAGRVTDRIPQARRTGWPDTAHLAVNGTPPDFLALLRDLPARGSPPNQPWPARVPFQRRTAWSSGDFRGQYAARKPTREWARFLTAESLSSQDPGPTRPGASQRNGCSRRHLPILDTENTGAWHYSVCGRP